MNNVIDNIRAAVAEEHELQVHAILNKGWTNPKPRAARFNVVQAGPHFSQERWK